MLFLVYGFGVRSWVMLSSVFGGGMFVCVWCLCVFEVSLWVIMWLCLLVVCVVRGVVVCGSDVFGFGWFSGRCVFRWVILLRVVRFCVP